VRTIDGRIRTHARLSMNAVPYLAIKIWVFLTLSEAISYALKLALPHLDNVTAPGSELHVEKCPYKRNETHHHCSLENGSIRRCGGSGDVMKTYGRGAARCGKRRRDAQGRIQSRRKGGGGNFLQRAIWLPTFGRESTLTILRY